MKRPRPRNLDYLEKPAQYLSVVEAGGLVGESLDVITGLSPLWSTDRLLKYKVD